MESTDNGKENELNTENEVGTGLLGDVASHSKQQTQSPQIEIDSERKGTELDTENYEEQFNLEIKAYNKLQSI
jgi:hypothetical protein